VAPTLNEGQGAAQGISQAEQGFTYQSALSNATANPYLSGLNLALNGANTGLSTYNALNGGVNSSSPYGVSTTQANNLLGEYYGIPQAGESEYYDATGVGGLIDDTGTGVSNMAV
jgi:hypothetical protein